MTARQRNHAISLWPGGGTPVLIPDTSLEETSWQAMARCAEVDPEAYFPEKGGSTASAKKVCFSCEVRQTCLEYALEHDERFGIWGGLSERQRRRLRQSREQEAHAS
jgi:WhiB family redox-sensing transcriptional regulator